jgi:parallel beta-helix repeat protein
MNSIRSSAFLALVIGGAASAAPPATIHIANNGVDSATCGGSAAPCRSIYAGLQRARAGDTVLVRPGLYGDLNGDGLLGGAGEEPNLGRTAVYVDKAVRLLSTNGAVVTVINAGGGVFNTVEINSNGVTFGAVDQGFTVAGAQFQGIYTFGITNARISGNIAAGLPSSGILVESSGVVEVSDNVVHDNGGSGITALASSESARVLIRRNKVYANSSGINAGSFGSHEISHNEISNNLNAGLSLDFTPSMVFRNLITGNGIGITSNSWSPDRLPTAGPTLVRNTLIGNQTTGVQIAAGPVPFTLRENNVYGNGTGPYEYFANCGVANFSGAPLNLANTYWGAGTGPGANPADSTCGNDPVITTPFATRPN